MRSNADRVAFHCSGTDATYREMDRLRAAFEPECQSRHKNLKAQSVDGCEVFTIGAEQR